MENAAEALKMAGAVLIFVLALSIIIFSFGQARESADIILDYRDRETEYIDAQFYYPNAKTERNVNLETVITSVFRAYLENYKIVFDGLNDPIYKIKNKNGELVEKYTLDLETNQNNEYKNVTLANDEQKVEFIKGILYGKYSNRADFEEKFDIDLFGCNSIYEQLTEKVSQGKVIKEYLGVYYQNDSPDVPDVNKIEKRIITYKIED